MSGTPKCNCGFLARRRTSWTDRNPGRRFWGCGCNQGRNNSCGFFAWYDPPICERSKTVILGLLMKIRELEGSLGQNGASESLEGSSTVSVVELEDRIIQLEEEISSAQIMGRSSCGGKKVFLCIVALIVVLGFLVLS